MPITRSNDDIRPRGSQSMMEFCRPEASPTFSIPAKIGGGYTYLAIGTLTLIAR